MLGEDKLSKNSLNKNRLYYLMYNVLNIAFPLLSGIYVSHVLMPETIGEVAYAQNIVNYFVVFSFLGIPTYGMREISKVKEDKLLRDRLFTELLIINFVSTCIFSVAYLWMCVSVKQFYNQIKLFLVVGILLALNSLNISWLYEGLEKFKFISLRNLIFKAFSFLFLVIFVREDENYLLYAAVSVIGTAGNYLINVVYAHRFVNITFKGISFKRHIKPILYLVAVNLAIEIYSMVDVTMLGALCTKEEVAYYSYASKIQKILVQILNSFTIVVVPRMVTFFKKDMEKFNAVIDETLKLLYFLSIPIVVGCWFVGNDMVVVLYGESYIYSGIILKILTTILLISPTGYLLGSRVMLVSGNENKMLTAVAFGAVVNVIGNSLLIPKLGGAGAAIASLVGELVVMGIYLNFGLRIVCIKGFKKSLIQYMVSAFVMAIILLVLDIPNFEIPIALVIKIVVGAIVYFSVLLITREEIATSMLEKVIKKIKK